VRSHAPPTTISGFAYPGETLTSPGNGQWYVDDVPIIGETGDTFVVRIDDIGKPVRQTNSNALTTWHPNQIAGVAAFFWSRGGVLTSISPDVPASDAESVRRWLDRTQPPFNAEQSVGGNQPTYRATGQSGGPSVEFDGTNDVLIINNLSALKNVGQAYLLCGLRATNPTGGSASQPIINYSVGSGASSRLAIFTRRSSNSVFQAIGRRLDAQAVSTDAQTTSDNNYNVLVAHGDYENGFIRLRLNGAEVASTALPSSGNTSNTDSQESTMGALGAGYCPAHVTCAMVVNQAISAAGIARLERFIGLHGGLNIPLV